MDIINGREVELFAKLIIDDLSACNIDDLSACNIDFSLKSIKNSIMIQLKQFDELMNKSWYAVQQM